ncbi:MAG TPA: hypothetical protein VN606_11905 [Thermoleophilaceae bacterium]|jgi:hypothetical protein|nr:hypothetical protein [Thermoleophilaceae bacterium]
MTTTDSPTPKDILERIAESLGFVFLAGPPVAFLLVPWLIVVLLIIPPAALLLTLVAVVVVVGAVLAAIGAIIASPYLIVRHLRTRHAAAQARVTDAPTEAPAPRLAPAA